MNIGKENEYTEFKRSTSKTKEAINAIAAMLNKHNKGKVYFGVKNNGDVIGQDIRPETLNELSRDITINIKPSFIFTVEEKIDGDGIHYIEVTFSGTRTPYSAYNRYYLRFHDENRIMDNEMLRDYYRLSSNDYSQWEKMSSNIDLNSIDNEQLESFIDHGKQNGRLKYDTDNRITLLSRLGLLYNDQYLNNAGNVLFGSYSPVMVRVVTFASNSRLTVLDQNVFEGNIFRCVEDVMTYIRKNISWRYEFTGSSHRLEVPEVPTAALREIVVNAFAHGEYQSTTDLEVTIFKNRISIYSPGHFPAQYTPVDFSSGKLEPIPMNPTITNILYIDGLIEKLSTGFERVFELCRSAQIEYSYQNTNNGFRFNFMRPSASPETLTTFDKQVLKTIESDPSKTIKEMAQVLQCTSRTIDRTIQKLKALNLIRRIGSARTGHWEIL